MFLEEWLLATQEAEPENISEMTTPMLIRVSFGICSTYISKL